MIQNFGGEIFFPLKEFGGEYFNRCFCHIALSLKLDRFSTTKNLYHTVMWKYVILCSSISKMCLY